MLTFLHIGRTGGLTLRHIIMRGLPSLKKKINNFIGSIPWDAPNKAIVNWIETRDRPPILCSAHYVGYGIHKLIDSKYTVHSQYITILREPLSRAISILSSGRGGIAFNGSKENVDMILFGKIPESFGERIITQIQNVRTDNVMTRTLGCEDGKINFNDSKPCSIDI